MVLSGWLMTCRLGLEAPLEAGLPSVVAWSSEVARCLLPGAYPGPRSLIPRPWAAAGAMFGLGAWAQLLAEAAAGSSRLQVPYQRWVRPVHIEHALSLYALQSASGLAVQRAWRLVAAPGTAKCGLAVER